MTNVEKLSQIKRKLVKYSDPNEKNVEKISHYLNQLKSFKNINNEVLEETGLIECLKKMKKKQDADYSKEAEDVLNRWKSILAGESAPKEGGVRENNNNKAASQVKPVHEKRPSTTNLVSMSESKKPKLSLDDYKDKLSTTIKKEPQHHHHIEKIDSLNRSLKNIDTIKKQQQIKPESKSPPQTIDVPLPTMPLNDILSSLMPSSKPAASTNGGGSQYQSNGGIENRRSLPQHALPTASTALFKGPSEDEILSNIFSSKHSKKMLYTGRRQVDGPSGGYQPSRLHDLASRVLIDNLNDLPTRIAAYNAMNDFPVAFDLIKGVLDRANAKQLKTIEYYSPHLLVDTDDMWKRISEQEFKNVHDRDADEETWREYYFRKSDEREAKLQKARDAVSRLQANKPKERQTQMATVKFVSSTSSRPIIQAFPKSFDSGAQTKAKSNHVMPVKTTESIPVRKIIHDTPGIRRPGSAVGAAINSKRPGANATPAMSQGMKATMKLIKKSIRR